MKISRPHYDRGLALSLGLVEYALELFAIVLGSELRARRHLSHLSRPRLVAASLTRGPSGRHVPHALRADTGLPPGCDAVFGSSRVSGGPSASRAGRCSPRVHQLRSPPEASFRAATLDVPTATKAEARRGRGSSIPHQASRLVSRRGGCRWRGHLSSRLRPRPRAAELSSAQLQPLR